MRISSSTVCSSCSSEHRRWLSKVSVWSLKRAFSLSSSKRVSSSISALALAAAASIDSRSVSTLICRTSFSASSSTSSSSCLRMEGGIRSVLRVFFCLPPVSFLDPPIKFKRLPDFSPSWSPSGVFSFSALASRSCRCRWYWVLARSGKEEEKWKGKKIKKWKKMN